MNEPEYDLWFSMDRPSVLSAALQDSMMTPKPLPDYTVDDSNTSEWRNIRDKRRRITEENNAILSGRDYVRAFFKNTACIEKLEEVWELVDKEPSFSVDYRKLLSPRVGGSNETAS